MRRRQSIITMLLLMSFATAVTAQERVAPLLNRTAIRRAVDAVPPPQPQTRGDWRAVTSLREGRDLVVTADGGKTTLRGGFVDADADGVTLRLENRSGTSRIDRARIDRVEARRRRAGVLGAVIGGAAAGLIASVAVVNIIQSDCGRNGCGNQVIAAWTVGVGVPIAGALLGSRIPIARNSTETIYAR